jgi:hypothetical protein
MRAMLEWRGRDVSARSIVTLGLDPRATPGVGDCLAYFSDRGLSSDW